MSLPVNYLEVETLLLARIAAQLNVAEGDGSDLQKVGGVVEFEATLESDGPYPSAYVLYDGEEIDPKGHDGRRMMATHRWQVCLLTHPAITPETGAASLVATGTLLSQLIDAISGWTPAAGYRAMKRVQARGQSVVYANGLAMFVLDFEVDVPITLGDVP